MKDLKREEFERVKAIGTLMLVIFSSGSCNPCIEAENFLLTLEQAYNKRCSIVKINVDYEKVVSAYEIIKLPTFILFKNNIELVRFVGYGKSKENEIEKAIRSNI